MKVLAIIPARGGSKGIPRKNLRLLDGKPMIEYTIKAALNSKQITRAIITTEDDEIIQVSKKLNIEVIKRPKKLANDSSALEPVMKHVLEYLRHKENYKPELIVLLQPTSPLRNSNHIDESILKLKKNQLDSILSVSESKALVWKKQKETQISPITYDPFNRKNRQKMNDKVLENGAIYITKTKTLFKSKNRLGGKISIYKMSFWNSFDINTLEDFINVENIIKKIKSN